MITAKIAKGNTIKSFVLRPIQLKCNYPIKSKQNFFKSTKSPKTKVWVLKQWTL